MKPISRTFLRGLFTLLPVVLTIYLVVWLATTLESALGALIRLALPEGWYVPGLGLAVAVVLVFVFGLVLEAWLLRKLWDGIDALLRRAPVVRMIYTSIKDVTEYLGGTQVKETQQVVAVKLGEPPTQLLGFITRQSVGEMPDAGDGDRDRVAVYLPMSYQLGGYTVVVPRSATQRLDMTVEQALRWCLTAGLVSDRKEPDRAGRGAERDGGGRSDAPPAGEEPTTS